MIAQYRSYCPGCSIQINAGDIIELNYLGWVCAQCIGEDNQYTPSSRRAIYGEIPPANTSPLPPLESRPYSGGRIAPPGLGIQRLPGPRASVAPRNDAVAACVSMLEKVRFLYKKYGSGPPQYWPTLVDVARDRFVALTLEAVRIISATDATAAGLRSALEDLREYNEEIVELEMPDNVVDAAFSFAFVTIMFNDLIDDDDRVPYEGDLAKWQREQIDRLRQPPRPAEPSQPRTIQEPKRILDLEPES